MTLNNALDKVRDIQKDLHKIDNDISKYVADNSTLSPIMESQEKQKEYVSSQIQSYEDKIKLYLKLKKNIDYTNLMTEVTWDGEKYFISDILMLKTNLNKLILFYSNILNEEITERQKVERFNSSKTKQDRIINVRTYFNKDLINEKLSNVKNKFNTLDTFRKDINNKIELIEKF